MRLARDCTINTVIGNLCRCHCRITTASRVPLQKTPPESRRHCMNHCLLRNAPPQTYKKGSAKKWLRFSHTQSKKVPLWLWFLCKRDQKALPFGLTQICLGSKTEVE